MQISVGLVVLAVSALVCVGFALSAVLRIIRKARIYIATVSACGYMSPPPSPGFLTFFDWFARFVLFIQVGKVKITGKQHLKTAGPLIIAANHPHYADPGVMAVVFDRQPVRYLAAQRLFNFAGGLVSLLAAPVGAISVNLTPGKGGPARETAIQVLTSGQNLMMWPEGYAYMDGHLGEFKKGAVRIAKESGRRLGRPVHIVPVNIRYGRYPGKWINNYDCPVQYLIVLLCSWCYRRGATVVIGEPISSADLPADDTQATELLRARIIALDPVQS